MTEISSSNALPVRAQIYEIANSPEVQQAVEDYYEAARLAYADTTTELATPVDSKIIDQAKVDFLADVDDLI